MSRAQRSTSEAQWCAAEPGPFQRRYFWRSRVCSAALHAALRPGHNLGMSRRYFVYILTNTKRGVLYVGLTNNLVRRLEQHRAKAVPSFTSEHGLTRLVYLEEYSSINEARARERVLKRWRRDWKFKLIEELNPDWDDLSSRLAV